MAEEFLQAAVTASVWRRARLGSDLNGQTRFPDSDTRDDQTGYAVAGVPATGGPGRLALLAEAAPIAVILRLPIRLKVVGTAFRSRSN
jgi:hypothetical protein